MVLLITGVSGAGKTTIGQALAATNGWAFADADDYHPDTNRQKMASGIALTDVDRAPWLQRLRELIEAHLASDQPLVLACSALKVAYREKLVQRDSRVRVVYLKGSFEAIAARLAARKGHFMPGDLLQSQFDALEEPDEVGTITVDIAQPTEAIVSQIQAEIAPPSSPK